MHYTMKTSFNDEIIYDQTESQTEIVTNEQFDKADLDTEKEDQDALVQIASTRTQVMEVEDFMELVKNKAESIHNIDQKIPKMKAGIEDYKEAYDDEMDLMERLDKEKKSDTTRQPVPANSLTMHHMEAYKGLKEEEGQIEKLKDQREKVIGQIEDMWSVCTRLFDEGQPVPHSVVKLDEFDTEEWEDDEQGYEETEIETENEEGEE